MVTAEEAKEDLRKWVQDVQERFHLPPAVKKRTIEEVLPGIKEKKKEISLCCGLKSGGEEDQNKQTTSCTSQLAIQVDKEVRAFCCGGGQEPTAVNDGEEATPHAGHGHEHEKHSKHLIIKVVEGCDPSAFKPVAVIIGPSEETLQERQEYAFLEGHKSDCACFLLSRNIGPDPIAFDRLLGNCLKMIQAKCPDITKCYKPEIQSSSFPDDEKRLAELMFFDGCFIIARLLQKNKECHNPQRERPKFMPRAVYKNGMLSVPGNKMDPSKASTSTTGDVEASANDGGEYDKVEDVGNKLGRSSTWKQVDEDLLKLQNQIPFMVLEELYKLLKKEEDEAQLTRLALKLFHDISPPMSKSFQPEESGRYDHLLHLFYSSRVPPNRQPDSVRDHHHGRYECEWIPSAAKLRKIAGVAFRENQNWDSFVDIKFNEGKWFKGDMRIPRLYLDEGSGPIFHNLVAFEQYCHCSIHATSTPIMSYVVFMDCLVKTTEDVDLLDVKQILIPNLSRNEQVPDFFDKLKNQIHNTHHERKNLSHDLFLRVNEFRQTKMQRQCAILKRDYCSSPFTIISLTAAIALVLMALVTVIYNGTHWKKKW